MSNQIEEIKTTLDGRQQTFLCKLLHQDSTSCVLSHTLNQTRKLHTLVLPKDTLTVAYFWQDKPYNLYHFLANKNRDRTSLVYYFNICDQVHWQADRIEWRDLTVDVFVQPKHEPIVLDTEQLPGNLPKLLSNYITRATNTVMEIYQQLIYQAEQNSRHWLEHIKSNLQK